MKTVNYKKNEYRYVTVAVDSYENRKVRGRIWHNALQEEAGFGGWIDFMRIVNQIYDKTEFPKQTVHIRTFKPLQKRELCWKDRESEGICQSAEGSFWTFTLWIKYRYHASWQGTVICSKTEQAYRFESFLELLSVMDSIMLGRSPSGVEPEAVRCTCRLAANEYDGCDMKGELQRASHNWSKEFTSIAGLIANMSELSGSLKKKRVSKYRTLVTGDSLSCYRSGGRKATFVIQILYRQHNTWQGFLYCKEQKTEKPFRSFMEMLYLMASALEADIKYKKSQCSPGVISLGYRTQEYGIQKRIEQIR